MVTINLIAWRQAERLYQQRKFKQIMLQTFLLSILIILSAQAWMYYRCYQLQSRVFILKHKVNSLHDWRLSMQNKTIENDQTETLQHLRQYQLKTHAIITSLMNMQTTDICFNRVARKNRQVSVMGHARSADDLMHFIDVWPAASLFTEIRFLQLKQAENHTVTFHFVANERYPAFQTLTHSNNV